MRYTIKIKKSAEKELDILPEYIYRKIRDKVLALENNPRPLGAKRLRGKDGYRIRIGNYRIVYIVDDEEKLVEIISVGHRREVYK